MTPTHDTSENGIDETSTTKYMIYADFVIEGVVEKPDVVGALFGQTEGLLSDDLDLRELQKGGRVGRIQVSLQVRGGRTRGNLTVPSSLDRVETSILAAALETVDRIGPCNAKITVKKIEDIREEKRKKIIERASVFLKNWDMEVSPESSEIADEVLRAARVGRVTHFGTLPAGPEVNASDTIIIVEGRADIAACLRAGIRNTVAVQGAQIPKAIIELSKKKTAIAFLDGDRGGDLILKELLMDAYIDYVARAPEGREVEDLKPKEIVEQLKNKVPIDRVEFVTQIHADELIARAKRKRATKVPSKAGIRQRAGTAAIGGTSVSQPSGRVSTSKASADRKRASTRGSSTSSTTSPSPRRPAQRGTPKAQSKTVERKGRPRTVQKQRADFKDRRDDRPRRIARKLPEDLQKVLKTLEGKEIQEGILLDKDSKEIKRVPVASLYEEIKNTDGGIAKVIFDGIITQRLIDLCQEKKIEILAGARIAELEKKPISIKLFTFGN